MCMIGFFKLSYLKHGIRNEEEDDKILKKDGVMCFDVDSI